MKQKFRIGAAVPALALLAGCGGNAGTSVDPMMLDNAVVADANLMDADKDMMADRAEMTDQQFVDAAAASDAFEIEAGKMAAEKATAQALKDFGQMMVTQHGESTARLEAASAKAGVTPVAMMTAEQQANLESLRNASGADFDNIYRTQQVAAHQKALALLQTYAETGGQGDLKGVATETIPIVQKHYDLIQGM